MIITTDAASGPGWVIHTNQDCIKLSWLPFVFISGDDDCFDDITTGFDCIRVNAPANLKNISTDISRNAPLDGTCCFSDDFIQALQSGGWLYQPRHYQAWLDLILTQDQHPFVLSLNRWFFSGKHLKWYCRDKIIDLKKPSVMAIWNVSPDSFSSDCETDEAGSVEHAISLVGQNPDVIDVGAESTRPGAVSVTPDEEMDRLRKPLAWLRNYTQIPVSLDSRHYQTIRQCLECNQIDIVNHIGISDTIEDEDKRIYSEAARSHAGLIVMAYQSHQSPVQDYATCLNKIIKQLWERLNLAYNNGVDLRTVMVDPGIGFGKGLDNDFRLIFEASKALMCLGRPVLIAHSRKRCLAKALNISRELLDVPTAITAAAAISKGASMVRVHHVGLLKTVLATYEACSRFTGDSL